VASRRLGDLLVVLASRHDAAARVLVGRWSACGGTLLTPRDLSVTGWRHRVSRPGHSTAVVDGQPVAVRRIAGVLTRLARIGEEDLPQIAPAERSYVAAEMSAFLLCWLASLRCPVLNRPTPPALTSPCWAPERWVRLARDLGIPARPARRSIPPLAAHRGGAPAGDGSGHPDTGSTTVTVVGGRCLGAADGELAAWARQLAAAAGVGLLAVRFGGRRRWLLGADPWVDVGDDSVADAVLGHLLELRQAAPGR
jgi:hypothetical protein